MDVFALYLSLLGFFLTAVAIVPVAHLISSLGHELQSSYLLAFVLDQTKLACEQIPEASRKRWRLSSKKGVRIETLDIRDAVQLVFIWHAYSFIWYTSPRSIFINNTNFHMFVQPPADEFAVLRNARCFKTALPELSKVQIFISEDRTAVTGLIVRNSCESKVITGRITETILDM